MDNKQHLDKLEKEAREISYGDAKYWKLRCYYLEKHIDPTYSDEERSNCYYLWNILRNRTNQIYGTN